MSLIATGDNNSSSMTKAKQSSQSGKTASMGTTSTTAGCIAHCIAQRGPVEGNCVCGQCSTLLNTSGATSHTAANKAATHSVGTHTAGWHVAES